MPSFILDRTGSETMPFLIHILPSFCAFLSCERICIVVQYPEGVRHGVLRKFSACSPDRRPNSFLKGENQMGRKITVIGAGSVGSTITYTLAVDKIASEIVMIDVNEEKARGEAMDILQGMPFSSPTNIYAGDYSDAAGSDIVIITCGIARKAGQSRIDLAQTNVNIIKQIAPEIAKYAPDAIYIVVSNPVDILTYVFMRVSGIPEKHIIGSGTILDTSRLRSRIAEYVGISEQNIHAYVLGEHGDSSFVPWSIAQVGCVNLFDYRKDFHFYDSLRPELDTDEIEDYIRTSGGQIIKRKGATFYAVSISVCHIVKCLLGSANNALTVSSMMHGEYDIEDVCLSIPFIIGPHGVSGHLLPNLTGSEIGKLQNSANVLKNVIRQVDI